MVTSEERLADLSVCERRVLELLKNKGPQMLDALCELPGFTWAQVLLAIDHLSRLRQVSIEPIGRRDYQVSLTAGQG